MSEWVIFQSAKGLEFESVGFFNRHWHHVFVRNGFVRMEVSCDESAARRTGVHHQQEGGFTRRSSQKGNRFASRCGTSQRPPPVARPALESVSRPEQRTVEVP